MVTVDWQPKEMAMLLYMCKSSQELISGTGSDIGCTQQRICGNFSFKHLLHEKEGDDVLHRALCPHIRLRLKGAGRDELCEDTPNLWKYLCTTQFELRDSNAFGYLGQPLSYYTLLNGLDSACVPDVNVKEEGANQAIFISGKDSAEGPTGESSIEAGTILARGMSMASRDPTDACSLSVQFHSTSTVAVPSTRPSQAA